MANRTTYAEVIKIIDVDSNITTDLAPFIEVANDIVTDVCTDSSYTAAKLELIERWLTAHFYSIRDPQAKSEKAGSVGQAFFGKTGLNFAQTRWGQQAMMIDSKGNLSQVNKGRKRSVGATWLGTGDSDGNDNSE